MSFDLVKGWFSHLLRILVYGHLVYGEYCHVFVIIQIMLCYQPPAWHGRELCQTKSNHPDNHGDNKPFNSSRSCIWWMKWQVRQAGTQIELLLAPKLEFFINCIRPSLENMYSSVYIKLMVDPYFSIKILLKVAQKQVE